MHGVTAGSGIVVSVVLPFLNEERHLAGAVATVEAQRFVDWELLLVDDGSTDASAAFADRVAAADPTGRVRVIRHPGGVNRGLPASRNLGLAEARGEFLAFLDADDRWEPHKLLRQVTILRADQTVGMTCGPCWYDTVDGSAARRLVPVHASAPVRLGRGRFARLLVRGDLVSSPPPSNVMFRTSVLRAAGGVPPGDNLYEDQRTFVLTSLAAAVHVTDEALSTYAVRPDSLCGTEADDAMVQVTRRLTFERWVATTGRARGGAGVLLVADLALHRLRRGLRRRWAQRDGRARSLSAP